MPMNIMTPFEHHPRLFESSGHDRHSRFLRRSHSDVTPRSTIPLTTTATTSFNGLYYHDDSEKARPNRKPSSSVPPATAIDEYEEALHVLRQFHGRSASNSLTRVPLHAIEEVVESPSSSPLISKCMHTSSSPCDFSGLPDVPGKALRKNKASMSLSTLTNTTGNDTESQTTLQKLVPPVCPIRDEEESEEDEDEAVDETGKTSADQWGYYNLDDRILSSSSSKWQGSGYSLVGGKKNIYMRQS